MEITPDLLLQAYRIGVFPMGERRDDPKLYWLDPRLRAVLPDSVRIHAVGGVGTRNLAEWFQAGIDGVGIGTELFRPGYTVQDVVRRAQAVVAAFHACVRAA